MLARFPNRFICFCYVSLVNKVEYIRFCLIRPLHMSFNIKVVQFDLIQLVIMVVQDIFCYCSNPRCLQMVWVIMSSDKDYCLIIYFYRPVLNNNFAKNSKDPRDQNHM